MNTIIRIFVALCCIIYTHNTQAQTCSGDVNMLSPTGTASCVASASGFTLRSPGAPSNYPNNANSIYTVCPTNPGEKVRVVFSSISMLSGDVLEVYNGNSTAAPLIGSYSGTITPAAITSTATSGCLTFRFVSNSTGNSTGFSASVTSQPLGTSTCTSLTKLCAQAGVTIPYFANTSTAAASTTNPGNNYGCLTSTPRPNWFFVQMNSTSALSLTLTGKNVSNGNEDIDYALWGPFSSLAAATAACNTYGAPLACSYSSSATETVNIPASSVGQVYVLLITGFSSNINSFNVQSTGTTNCNDIASVCNVKSITLTSIGNCNNNGTPAISTDDFFTANVVVKFQSRPTTGTLNLTGSAIHSGTYSVNTTAITSDSMHTFTGVNLKTIGPNALTATFSANTSCTFTINNVETILPNGSIATNTPICEGSPATITFTSTAGTGPFSLIINGQTYSSVTSGTPFNINPYPSGSATYNLTRITDSRNCIRQ